MTAACSRTPAPDAVGALVEEFRHRFHHDLGTADLAAAPDLATAGSASDLGAAPADLAQAPADLAKAPIASADLAQAPASPDMSTAAPADLAAPVVSLPTLSALDPTTGPAGTILTVSGAGFQTGDQVQVSGPGLTAVALATLSLSSSAILARVALSAPSSPQALSVQVVRNGHATTGLPFTLTPGTVYYISTTGSDSNPGTLASPWATVSAASGKMKPGDVAYLRGGTYSGAVVINASGASGAPLSFVGYPGESALLVQPSTSPGADLDTVRVYGAYIKLDHLRITDQNNPGQAVWIANGAHDVTLSNSEIFGSYGQGILISGSNNLIYRDSIHDNGSHVEHDHGIYIEGANNVIRSNAIYNNFTFGVHMYNGYSLASGTPTGGTLVEYNYIYHNGYGSYAVDPTQPSSGVIIAYQVGNDIVRYNRVCDNAMYGIYLIDGQSNNQIYGNVTCYNKMGGSWMKYPGSNNSFTNNVSYNDYAYALSSNPGVTSDNNVYSAAGLNLQWSGTNYSLSGFQAASGQDLHSTTSAPAFTSLPTSGFTSTSASSYNFCTSLIPQLCQPAP